MKIEYGRSYHLTKHAISDVYGVTFTQIEIVDGVITDHFEDDLCTELTHDEALSTVRVGNGVRQHVRCMINAFCDIDPEKWAENPHRNIIY